MVSFWQQRILLHKARRHLLHAFRHKTGISASLLFSFGIAVTYKDFGPYLQDPFMRYALAGTVATVGVEVMTHGVDTVNM
jgi:hypothetical protein